MLEWHSIKLEGYPKEDGEYDCTFQTDIGSRYRTNCSYTNDIYELSNGENISFADNKGRKNVFYYYDVDDGYFVIKDPVAWVKYLDIYRGE